MNLKELEDMCVKMRTDGCTDETEIRYQTITIPTGKRLISIHEIKPTYRNISKAILLKGTNLNNKSLIIFE